MVQFHFQVSSVKRSEELCLLIFLERFFVEGIHSFLRVIYLCQTIVNGRPRDCKKHPIFLFVLRYTDYLCIICSEINKILYSGIGIHCACVYANI